MAGAGPLSDSVSLLAEVFQRFDPSIYLSLAFLFGIAAQFRAMDGYTLLRRLVSGLEKKIGVVFAVAAITAVFSPLILNDVVVLILTPVLIRYAKRFQVDIAPLILAEITFTNIASSLTPLGNPQNILIWQSSGVSAAGFVLGTYFPLLLSGAIAVVLLYPYSRRLGGSREFSTPVGTLGPAAYLALVAAVIFSSDLLGVPNAVALGIGFALGFPFTIRSLGRLPREFDLRSLLTLVLLVTATAAGAYFLRPYLQTDALVVASGGQPFSALFLAGLSSLISNVPATQLVLSMAPVTAAAAPKLAVGAGLAGNIDPLASFANVLALLMVRRAGLPIRKAILLQFVVGIVAFVPALL